MSRLLSKQRTPMKPGGQRLPCRRQRISFFLSQTSSVCCWQICASVAVINLINHDSGYLRILLTLASLYYMPLHPRTCSLLYSISCLLDAVDGAAARLFKQSTRFGAVLDMVTDRCTTSCLLVFLASAFPRWSIVFQGLISLDLASHYMHMYATLAMGGRSHSHKQMDKNRPWAMRIYY